MTTQAPPDTLTADLAAALEQTVPRYQASLRHAIEQAEGPDRLTMPQWRALQALARLGGETLTTVLARRLRVATPTATRMLDGLAERGLIARSPDPSSRRQTLIALTDEGRATVTRYEAIVAVQVRRLAAALAPDRQVRLLAALGDLAAALDIDGEGQP